MLEKILSWRSTAVKRVCLSLDLKGPFDNTEFPSWNSSSSCSCGQSDLMQWIVEYQPPAVSVLHGWRHNTCQKLLNDNCTYPYVRLLSCCMISWITLPQFWYQCMEGYRLWVRPLHCSLAENKTLWRVCILQKSRAWQPSKMKRVPHSHNGLKGQRWHIPALLLLIRLNVKGRRKNPSKFNGIFFSQIVLAFSI